MLISICREPCTVAQNGFEGVLFHPDTPGRRQTALIVVGGSEGGMRTSLSTAGIFASLGIPSLAVAYFGTKQTPRHLVRIPVETVLNATAFLRTQGYIKTGIYGISKGAEFALLSASLIPDISFVMAVSPSCCVFEGIVKPGYSGTSSWTWHGNELPYVSFNNCNVNFFRSLVKNHEIGFRSEYEQVLTAEKNETNTIKVENIRGPVLLLAAEHDAQWPSAEMAQAVSQRLREKKFPYSFELHTYYPAGHILCPVRSAGTKALLRLLYRVERTFPRECSRAREEALAFSRSWMDRI